MALRGVFFLSGGAICLLYNASPYLCLIAGVCMSLFNCNFSLTKYSINREMIGWKS